MFFFFFFLSSSNCNNKTIRDVKKIPGFDRKAWSGVYYYKRYCKTTDNWHKIEMTRGALFLFYEDVRRGSHSIFRLLVAIAIVLGLNILVGIKIK